MTRYQSLIKNGPHAGERCFVPDALSVHSHQFDASRQNEVRDRVRKDADERLVNVIGSTQHLRAKERIWDIDQNKQRDTCKVTAYKDGMGLRIERRQDGYSWVGKSTASKDASDLQADKREYLRPWERAAKTFNAKRGRIKRFTKASAARFRDKVWQLRKSIVPVMITLTYLAYPDPRKAKRDLDAFLKALRRKYPRAAGFWKLEPQKRGVPHFHLLVWNAKPWMRWVARTWARIAAFGDNRVLRAGTRVEKLRSYRGTLAYAGKRYMSKECEDSLSRDWGRYWGVFGAKDLPFAEALSEFAPGRLGVWIARTVRRWMRARSNGRFRRGARGRVVWVTTDYTGRWLECFDYLDRLVELAPRDVGLRDVVCNECLF